MTKADLIERLANEIEASARAEGASDEMLASWDMMEGDCDHVRAGYRAELSAADVHPSQLPASDGEVAALMFDAERDGEIATLIAEVESAVRELGRMSIALEASR